MNKEILPTRWVPMIRHSVMAFMIGASISLLTWICYDVWRMDKQLSESHCRAAAWYVLDASARLGDTVKYQTGADDPAFYGPALTVNGVTTLDGDVHINGRLFLGEDELTPCKK